MRSSPVMLPSRVMPIAAACGRTRASVSPRSLGPMRAAPKHFRPARRSSRAKEDVSSRRCQSAEIKEVAGASIILIAQPPTVS